MTLKKIKTETPDTPTLPGVDSFFSAEDPKQEEVSSSDSEDDMSVSTRNFLPIIIIHDFSRSLER